MIGRIDMPGPRAHLAGTLTLVDRFAAIAGGSLPEPLRRFLDRPQPLPVSVAPEKNAMKYDAYLSHHAGGVAWGVTSVERWEGEGLWVAIEALVAELGPGMRLDVARDLRADLAPRSPQTTLAVGFDRPGVPPRIKIYLQEDPWGAGVASRDVLAAAFARHLPGIELPGWLSADRAVGVVTVELLADGPPRVKAYVGGPDAMAAARGAPAEAQRLAEAMAKACPLKGYYYLTIRMAAGKAPVYAINKIYEHVQLGFASGGVDLPKGWTDVRALFEAAGKTAFFDALQAEIAGLPGVRVVPTATALEDEGRSADVYCAAWAR